MDPSSAAWWWEHGLDGVVGGLIGGAVTGLAGWLTIRHERRAAGLTHLREAAAQLQASGLRMLFAGTPEPDSVTKQLPDDWYDNVIEVATHMFTVSALSTVLAPALERDVDQAAEHVIGRSDTAAAELVGVVGAIAARCAVWAGDPAAYERQPEIDWDEVLREARDSLK